jgi:1,4-dihydroxy-2-naphthoate octaprenyltransferase
MASKWITLSRRNSEFNSYLDGSFSCEERALPVRSLNVDSVSEEVTFEIVPVHSISLPGLSEIVWSLLRPPTLVLSLGPMLATWLFCLARGENVNGVFAVLSLLGVLCFHSSMNLFNDYFDHMKGRDRLRARISRRAIQKGWVRAQQVKYAAWGLSGVAILCGLPAIAMHFAPLAFIAFLAALAGVEFAFQRLGLKERGFAEILAFILTGPLLTVGFAWAVAGSAVFADAVLGVVFGSISLLYFHLVNFESIMADDQAGVRTWATRAGFDASKTFFVLMATVVVGSTATFMMLFFHDWRLLPVFGTQIFFLLPLSRRVMSLASPLSSRLRGICIEGLKLSWLTLVVLAVAFLGLIVRSTLGPV